MTSLTDQEIAGRIWEMEKQVYEDQMRIYRLEACHRHQSELLQFGIRMYTEMVSAPWHALAAYLRTS